MSAKKKKSEPSSFDDDHYGSDDSSDDENDGEPSFLMPGSLSAGSDEDFNESSEDDSEDEEQVVSKAGGLQDRNATQKANNIDSRFAMDERFAAAAEMAEHGGHEDDYGASLLELQEQEEETRNVQGKREAKLKKEKEKKKRDRKTKEQSDTKDVDKEDDNSIAQEIADAVRAGAAQRKEEARAEAKAKRRKERELAKYRRFGEKLARRGIVYLARVPPFMRPEKVKHLLEQYGEVTRIYLAPEDEAIARRRKKLGGQRSTNYTEGWVEYAEKKVAKAVARSLNGTLIGGKKRSYYSQDMWVLKYLRHFTWSHLTEKKAYERRMAQDRLRQEMIMTKRSNDEFRELVDQGKMLRSIEERKTKRVKRSLSGAEQEEGVTGAENGTSAAAGEQSDATAKAASVLGFDKRRVQRKFFQHKPIDMDGGAWGKAGEQKRRGQGLDSKDLHRALGSSSGKNSKKSK